MCLNWQGVFGSKTKKQNNRLLLLLASRFHLSRATRNLDGRATDLFLVGIYNTRGHGWFIFYHFREIIRNGVLLSVDVVIPSLCQQYRICNGICGRAPPQKWSQCKFLNWARDRAMMRVSERATLAKRNNHREGRKSPPYLLRDECTSVIVTQVGFNQFVQIILISLTYYITMNIFDMSPHCTQCYVIYWSSSYCVT